MSREHFLEEFEQIYRQMEYYYQLMLKTSCLWQRNYYEYLLLNEMYKFIQLKRQEFVPDKQFTLKELAQYDGAKGMPAYVAVDGIVYDMSKEPTWGGGTHFGLYAGKDLSTQFAGCHGKQEILAALPKVGILIG